MACHRRIGGLGSFILLGALARAQVTQRVSVTSLGGQGHGASLYASISADGRWVAFTSSAGDLVAGDTNGAQDVFVRDRLAGTTERVSVATGGAQASGASGSPSISADGRCVAFWSQASDLVPGDTNGAQDVFVRDRLAGTTERVNVDSSGAQANGDSDSSRPQLSADGRFVAFDSFATNLVAGDTNGAADVSVRDRSAGTTERVSVDSPGAQANGFSYDPSIAADGRRVAFRSEAGNLVPGDTNLQWDVFVRDRLAGTTERVSLSSSGTEGNAGSHFPSISADGRHVAFESDARLVDGDTNGARDIFVRDRLLGTTERASVATGGSQANLSSEQASISSDGRGVAFRSDASGLVPGDTNGVPDVFLRDLQGGTTERMSVGPGGTQGNGFSGRPSISGDGRCVAFESLADDLAAADTNGDWDAFVRDRDGGPSFTVLCEPGVGGVIPCPCANPPGGAGLGCDNSAGTGGARLLAAGGTTLSSDSLVFTTGGERPTAASIVLQGNGPIPAGVSFGQGVRCAGGTILRRLFAKVASGGSITAPDFAAGDPTVSARSAAKGDPIHAGESRWYLVYYRDPLVSGGCPPTSTFNATPTGEVSWSP